MNTLYSGKVRVRVDDEGEIEIRVKSGIGEQLYAWLDADQARNLMSRLAVAIRETDE